MTEITLSAALLWLGLRGVALLLGAFVRPNLGAYNHVSRQSRREAMPTGCGCAVWMDKDGG